jgi:ribosomal protein S18 acetylase RimI-like enzyme
MLVCMIAAAVDGLTYRTIDPDRELDSAYENYRAACVASYGCDAGGLSKSRYAAWLRARIEEFPDGHVVARLGETRIGQLELEAPYGLSTGYVNVYCIAAPFRGMGFGKRMHRYLERYFRSWEATQVDLHVSPTNEPAVRFYRALGYRFVRVDGRMWRMSLDLASIPTAT